MNVFISGGCKNGKSYQAQRIAKTMACEMRRPLYYIATMIPHDEEDVYRIKRHLSEREGWGFETLEQGKDLRALLEKEGVHKKGVFLMDSVTALLANEMFDDAGNVDEGAPLRVKEDVVAFAGSTGNTVFVSDYIYGDGAEYHELTEMYRRGLAMIDRALALCCDRVIEVSAGIKEIWK
ncbi:MAG: adenosylcobinamide kinase/adenosylcobinamide-phosphate guanylyltransferase [Clostridiales bacterium]|nr:adenosylcobinamide kinase/adenosylcobinamide-phosphate guanylyltransferase [Clostridiales bacterium]